MDAFIGEIRPFAFAWAPNDWLLCNGGTYPVPQYQALYAIIGNTYGGTNGQTFNVPNLSGTALIGAGQHPGGSPYTVGKQGGVENVILNSLQMPSHSHTFNGATGGATSRKSTPADKTYYLTNMGYVAHGATTITPATGFVKAPAATPVTLNAATISAVGGAAAHENRQPYLAIGYYICAVGYFPVRP